MQGDTDPKSQYKHQTEQQGLARKEDLPDEPSSLDAPPHDNEGSKKDPKETSTAPIEVTDKKNTQNTSQSNVGKCTDKFQGKRPKNPRMQW